MNRVAIFRSRLLPVSETFVRDQATTLQRWEPVLLGLRREREGLSLQDLRHQLMPDISRLSFAWRSMLARPVPRLVDLLRRLEVRLVHAHFGVDGADVWPSVKAAELPLLVTLHGYDINIRREWWTAGHGGLARITYPDRLLRMARDPGVRFLAVSRAILQRAVERGIPEERISVGYVGVDTERLMPGGLPLDERHKRVLFVGRMVEKKAPLLLVRAVAALRGRIPDVELTMIGDGPLKPAAERLARDLRLPVRFLGARTPDEVLGQLHQARVLCLPSVTAPNGDAEGFGLTILEAQACGVPVVTSALGGAGEGLVHGKTGHSIAERDLPQLQESLLYWLLDDAAASAASVAGRQFVCDHFDIRRCTQRLELVYDSVLGADPATTTNT